MQEHKKQHIPVKIYRTDERLMIATPMAGLEPENILVDEWSVGVYHRELALPVPVNAGCANVTYGNGVLMVAFPISDQTSPARLRWNGLRLPTGNTKATLAILQPAFKHDRMSTFALGSL